MPLAPTPPKGSRGGARCRTTSLTHTPPERVLFSTARCASRERLKQYKASGAGRALTNAIASSSESAARIGRIGPKISSRITA